jgi:hypothetical protein
MASKADVAHARRVVTAFESRLAVQQITRDKKKKFLITGGSSVDLSGKACSPYTYTAHWTDDTYSLSSIRTMLERGNKTFFFITADYAFGHSIEAEPRRSSKLKVARCLGPRAIPRLSPTSPRRSRKQRSWDVWLCRPFADLVMPIFRTEDEPSSRAIVRACSKVVSHTRHRM